MSNPGTVNYPAALDDAVSLIDAGNNLSTTLAVDVAIAAVTIQLTSAAGFPTSGSATITDPVAGNEIIYYNGIVTDTLQAVVKGREGTSDLAHTAVNVTSVEVRPTARHHTVLRDAVIAAETELGVGARMSPIFNQRSTPTARTRVLPTGDFGSQELVRVGNGSLEIPATSSLSIYDTPGIPAQILQGGIRNVVRDYRAQPYPDAAPAIQRAIDDAASDGGGIVEIPPASTAGLVANTIWSYFYCSQIRMKPNVWLRGQGLGSWLFSTSSNPNAYMIVPDNPAVNNCGVTDMSLVSDGSGVAGGIGFDTGTDGPGDCRNFYRDLYIFGFPGSGVYFKGAWRAMTFRGIYMTNCGRVAGTGADGFSLNTNTTDNTIEGIQVGQSGNIGILDNGANNRYNSCKSFQSGQINASLGDGFKLTGSGAQLVRCESQQNSGHGYHLASLTYWTTLIGALSDSCGGDAFHLASVGRSHVQGYAIQNAGGFVHANIVGFTGTSDPNIVDVVYDPAALIAGGLPVAGYTGLDSQNEIKVRKFHQNAVPRGGAFDIVQRPIDLWEDVLLPTASDFSVNERLSIGATNSLEIPASSSLTIYNVS